MRIERSICPLTRYLFAEDSGLFWLLWASTGRMLLQWGFEVTCGRDGVGGGGGLEATHQDYYSS